MTISPTMNAENELLKEKSVLSTHDVLSKEVEEGNVEYKYKLCDVSEERLTKLISQMSWRLSEGFGEAIYELGISDSGIPIGLSSKEFNESLQNISKMAATLGADYSIICEREIQPDRKVAEVLIRKFSTETAAQLLDVRIAFLGNIDSGKSTTCGVLSSAGSQLDNGKGRARMNILSHKHEVECGRSSSISHLFIAFDSKGAIVNNYLQSQDNESLAASSGNSPSNSSPGNANNICKMINVIDMCGLEKYFKHTAYGMSKSVVDYAAIFISANVGLTKMTKEHLDLCIALKIPFFFVITKIDIASSTALTTITDNIHSMVKTPGIRKLSYVVKNEDDVITCAKNMSTDRIAPIFTISNVQGTNLNLLQQFMNLLPLRRQWETFHDKPTEIIIDQQFDVQNVGTVVSGIVYQGTVSVGDTVLLGPINEDGNFQTVQIKSIHYRRMGVKRVTSGQFATFALKFAANTTVPTIRKGMVLLEDAEMAKGVVWNFEAELILLNPNYVLKPNAQYVLHCLGVKQTAKLVHMEPLITSPPTTTGNKYKVQFQFLFRAEYMKEGERILVREGRIKSIGTVTKLVVH